jgi:hypothetical protein
MWAMMLLGFAGLAANGRYKAPPVGAFGPPVGQPEG